MSITIQILSGARYGETLTLDTTTSLGRDADITFDDAKMSKIHAIFQFQEGSGWRLVDNESKNGVFVNGKPISIFELSEGDLIDIGITQFRVGSIATYWKPQLNQTLLSALDKVKNGPMELVALTPIPVFKFAAGVQVGEKWVLEYGPRKAGGESDDLQIFEPKCPDIAFEIVPGTKGPKFKTDYPQIVKINSQSKASKTLAKGDKISIYNTVIAVDFISL